MKPLKTLSVVFSVAIFMLFINSCSKDDAGVDSYPKQVSVTYKVTSSTTSSAFLVQYRNETGGTVDVTNATLPYTKTFNRTVNQSDVLSLGYGTNAIQTVKLEISVDNVVVKSQEFTSTSGAIVYLFE